MLTALSYSSMTTAGTSLRKYIFHETIITTLFTIEMYHIVETEIVTFPFSFPISIFFLFHYLFQKKVAGCGRRMEKKISEREDVVAKMISTSVIPIASRCVMQTTWTSRKTGWRCGNYAILSVTGGERHFLRTRIIVGRGLILEREMAGCVESVNQTAVAGTGTGTRSGCRRSRRIKS